MKRKHALLVFAILLSTALAAGLDSMRQTRCRVQDDVNRALALTLRQCPPDYINADTIRVYRSHIRETAVRDTAILTLTVSEEKNSNKAQLRASAGLTLLQLWTLSDQRAAATCLMAALLWLILCTTMGWCRHGTAATHPQALPEANGTLLIGSLCHDEASHHFSVNGSRIHFTPMQQTLMELFMHAPGHTLTHREICEHLWPRKTDAAATLHTLVRRLKPVLQEAAGVTINCQRGVSYQLEATTPSK